MTEQLDELRDLGYTVEISQEGRTEYVDPELGIQVDEDFKNAEIRNVPAVIHVSGPGLETYVTEDNEEVLQSIIDTHEERKEQLNAD